LAKYTDKKFRILDVTPEEEAKLLNKVNSTYDEVIDEFLKSGKQIGKIEIDGVSSATTYYGLRRTVKRRKLEQEIKVKGLNRGVALLRLDKLKEGKDEKIK
jgi:hypothetical protein